MRIVVIEDNPDLLELISIVLTSRGYIVFQASNGADGLALARQEQPDLIVADVEMEGLSGLDVIRQIRADSCLAHRPVVALTACAMRGDRERLLAAGFTGYISKPIRAHRLADQLHPFIQASPHSATSTQHCGRRLGGAWQAPAFQETLAPGQRVDEINADRQEPEPQ